MNAATTRRMLQRPIYGGVFGRGLYSLATVPLVARGLHAVRFMVVDPRNGTVLAVAEEKLQALASARRMLRRLPSQPAANDESWFQSPLWPELVVDQPIKVRSISRRRREVFDRCEGRCHYCHASLALDGRWHVEHMVPRALGGASDAGNLVAACAPCNLAKSDRTALEFVSSAPAMATEEGTSQ